MTGLVVFLLLILIVMQSKLLQDLLGIVVLAFVAAVAYGYYINSTTEQPAAEAQPAVIYQAPEVQVPKDQARPPATSPGRYNFDPAPRPYRQQ